MLADPTIDAAVLETARGGIVREGLAFDGHDVGVVLNISTDHLGIGGVHTLADLARVKSVVVRAVRKRGTSVLNADDERVRRMSRDAGGRIAYFTMGPVHRMPGAADLREHLVAALEHDDTLVIHDREAPTPSCARTRSPRRSAAQHGSTWPMPSPPPSPATRRGLHPR